MRIAISLMLALAACGDNLPGPDPKPDASAPMVDAGIDASPDAEPDAPPDGPACAFYRQFSCPSQGVIWQICVPPGGCSEPVVCDGNSYSFCSTP